MNDFAAYTAACFVRVFNDAILSIYISIGHIWFTLWRLSLFGARGLLVLNPIIGLDSPSFF